MLRRHRTRMWATLAAVAAGVGLPALPAAAASPAGPAWSVLSPPTSPPALRSAAVAYDPDNQTVVLFGGVDASGHVSDATWVWDGSTWTQANPFGARPPARELASMTFDSALGQLVLFGGSAADGTLLDDTWVWNGASWNQVATLAGPGAREGAAMAPGPNGQLLLFGGYGFSAAPTTTSASSTSGPDPSTTTSTTTSTTVPPATGSPSGTTATTPTSPAPASTTTTTTTPTTTTSSAAADSTVTTPTDVPVTSAASAAVLSDTWTLGQSSGTDAWQLLQPTHHPQGVWGATLAGTGSSAVLFGGSTSPPGAAGGGLSDATWTWTGSTWRREHPPTSPPARDASVMADDTDLGTVVLWGGAAPGGALADAWGYAGGRWTRLSPQSPPPAAAGAAGVYDAASRQLLVFGGAGSSRLSSATVVLTAQPPTQLSTSPSTTVASAPPGATTARAGRSGVSAVASGATAGLHGTTTARQLSASATRLRVGDVVTLSGGGFRAGAVVTITFHSTAVTVASTHADGSGRFRVAVTVPDHAAAGVHHFDANGMGPHGPVSLVTAVRVTVAAAGRAVSVAVKGTLFGIAIAIPLATWLALDTVERVRRRSATA